MRKFGGSFYPFVCSLLIIINVYIIIVFPQIDSKTTNNFNILS